MFKFKDYLEAAGLLLVLSLPAGAGEEIKTNSGVKLTQAEIRQWSITIYPDGRNLPQGSGNAIEGEKLYQSKCLMCHGPSGERGVAPRLAGKLGYTEWNPHPLLALTVGAWPHTTSIFDYIRRAMPHQSPKTLTDSEVYSLTAYILNLNGIIDKNDELNRVTLPQIEMPYKKKSYIAWDVDEGGKLNDREPSH
ncbi:cytochrome c [Thalassomonas viridans]|uniref:Cytochrome c n=1 Tax=Thalassomonas viridans TaxID=137584 RepID=A0AAF0CAQ1_9GAMM|nr:cytochrome c [Thalassomonas viridans]WDE08817.1 cytochrome c [Thalassomonas viridans]